MRLIDADLIDMDDMDFHTSQTRAMACEAAQDIVDAQPTVEAEPVVHAHWEDVTVMVPNMWVNLKSGRIPCHAEARRGCSHCHHVTREYDPPRCPYCGARMYEEAH